MHRRHALKILGSIPFIGLGSPNPSDYKEDYRSVALRGPLLMDGWGYDLKGFPVPMKTLEEKH